MPTELIMRFEYGYDAPWVRRTERGLTAIAGPNAPVLDSPIELKAIKMRHEADFTVHKGEELAFVLAWYRSHEDPPFVLDTARALEETMKFWRDWCAGVRPVSGEWNDLANAVSKYFEGADLRSDRRHRCHCDDVAPGVHWWRTELGLPILLGL
jgi:GH15 family glucan-1,4-alpha-glucosidase